MAFPRSYPNQQRTVQEYESELQEVNSKLHEALEAEVSINRHNERYINQLEQDCTRCEHEIQSLNSEIERLENASKEEIAEMNSEISSLKIQLSLTKKGIRDKDKHISSIESQLEESTKLVQKLRCRIKTISSRKNSPVRGNSPDHFNSSILDSYVSKTKTDMALPTNIGRH